MINKKEASVLSFIIKRQKGNDYIFLSPAEIIDNVTESIDKEELLRLLTDLSGREAIKIKMLNMDECVLITTAKAKVLVDEFNDSQQVSSVVIAPNTSSETTSSAAESPKKHKIFSIKKAEEAKENKPQIVKAVVDYKKIFWSAFTGALCGGGIIAIIMLIINVAA